MRKNSDHVDSSGMWFIAVFGFCTLPTWLASVRDWQTETRENIQFMPIRVLVMYWFSICVLEIEQIDTQDYIKNGVFLFRYFLSLMRPPHWSRQLDWADVFILKMVFLDVFSQNAVYALRTGSTWIGECPFWCKPVDRDKMKIGAWLLEKSWEAR